MNKKERASKKATRREFLKKAAMGSITGSALLAGLGLSGTAAERFMKVLARGHSDDFFSRVRTTSPTEQDAQAFHGIVNIVRDLIDNDETLLRNACRIVDTVIGDVQGFDPRSETSRLGFATDKTNLLAAGYLGALNALRLSVPSREQISRFLSDPASLGRSMEPGFVDSLFNTAKSALNSDSEFARNAGSAVSRLAEEGEGVHDCWIFINVPEETPCWVPYVLVAVVVVICVVSLIVALC